MQSHRFPGPEFPALPAISIDVPDDWTADAAPSVLMVLAAPDSPSGFRPNVTVRVDRTIGTADLRSVAEAAAAAMTAEPEYRPQGEELVEVDGHPALLRVHTFIPVVMDGAPVFQALCVVVVPTKSPGFADVITIVASCLAADAANHGELFREIVDSTTITLAP